MEPAELLTIFRENIVIVRGVLQAAGGGQTDHVKLVDRPTDGGSFRVFGESRAVPVKALMAAAPDDRAPSRRPYATTTWTRSIIRR